MQKTKISTIEKFQQDRVGIAIGKSIAATAIAILAKIDSRYRYRYFNKN